MPDLETADPTTANYDAQQLVEEIAADDKVAPKVDVDADYERSKQFDVAKADQPLEAARAADPSPVAESTGAPEDFLKMAKQVTPDLDA
jgi:hypothetical protein